MRGAFAASGVSNTYNPSGDHGFAETMRHAGVSILSCMATDLAAEFWPDGDCKASHKCPAPKAS